MYPQVSKFTQPARAKNKVAAGFGDTVVGNVQDMAGFEGVLIIVFLGAIAGGAGTVVKAQGGAASNGSDLADILGSGNTIVDTEDNKIVMIDIYRPQQRYITGAVARAAANIEVDAILMIPYGARKMPTPLDANTSALKVLISPALGAA